LTGQILSLAASTASLNAPALCDMLRRCRISDVQSWLQEKIKAGIHVARREDLIEPNCGTKLAQPKNAATPTF
jgi:Zn-dependent M32 family carboxypeptidase